MRNTFKYHTDVHICTLYNMVRIHTLKITKTCTLYAFIYILNAFKCIDVLCMDVWKDRQIELYNPVSIYIYIAYVYL